jgi:hypothetical protein
LERYRQGSLLFSEYFIGQIFVFLLKNCVQQQFDLFHMGVMSADFERVENGAENNRYNETRDKDGYIDFES